MKKVLLCERKFSGHRRVYLKWISETPEIEFYSFAPENTGLKKGHFFKYEMNGEDSIFEFLKWTKRIRMIVKENDIDVVHFLDGDSIMKFFGIGFWNLGAKKVIVTYHHFFSGFARRISYLMMNITKGSTSIVHTDAVKESLCGVGIKDVRVCRYPAFSYNSIEKKDTAQCKAYFNLPENVPVIGVVGGMSDYKNVVPFLEIMQDSCENFIILLCGKADEKFKVQTETVMEALTNKVSLNLKHLSDEEYEMAIVASDIVYCIYNHSFDGASGPLTDGVCANKMILSCAHGSLGSIVTENHLGFTAECTDAEEILEQTEKAIKSVGSFAYDEIASEYRKTLMPERFQETYRKIYES